MIIKSIQNNIYHRKFMKNFVNKYYLYINEKLILELRYFMRYEIIIKTIKQLSKSLYKDISVGVTK